MGFRGNVISLSLAELDAHSPESSSLDSAVGLGDIPVRFRRQKHNSSRVHFALGRSMQGSRHGCSSWTLADALFQILHCDTSSLM